MKFVVNKKTGLLKCYNDTKTVLYALAGPVKLLMELELILDVQDASKISDKWLIVENNEVEGERESEVYPDKAAAKAEMTRRYANKEA
jgi:hypothetical protein